MKQPFCLPRGVLPIVAMIGIWKSGAAWALVEDTYTPDRIAYIRQDCGCKLELDAKTWDQVMQHECLKQRNLHSSPNYSRKIKNKIYKTRGI